MCPAARPGAGGPSVPGPRAAPAAAATACRRNSGNFRKKATGSPPFPRPFFRCGGCGRPPYTGTGAVIPSPIFSPLAGRERPPACRVVFHRPCSGGCCPVRSVRAPGLCCLALCRPGRCLATPMSCNVVPSRSIPVRGAVTPRCPVQRRSVRDAVSQGRAAPGPCRPVAPPVWNAAVPEPCARRIRACRYRPQRVRGEGEARILSPARFLR